MSYLLFLRSSADLERACRDVSDYFAFRRTLSGPASLSLYGAWIEPNTLSCIPLALVPPVWPSGNHGFAIQERFGVAGIWQLARLDVPPEVSRLHALPDAIIDSLRGIAGAEAGLFAPVFDGALTHSAMDQELKRLRTRYRGMVAPPLVQNAHDGALERLPAGTGAPS